LDKTLKQLKDYLFNLDKTKSDIKLFCNNLQITRQLLSPHLLYFYGSLRETVGRFHYNDIYEIHNVVKPQMIVPVCREFKINYALIDLDNIPGKEWLQTLAECKELIFKKIHSYNNFILYSVY
jgi:hypothetical protein